MLERVQQVGRLAALEAGKLLRQAFSEPQKISWKGIKDPVTENDIKSQDLIVRLIHEVFPRHRILAEEKGSSAAAGDDPTCCWIIDPIDGTVNFAHGFPMFMVSIAFEQEGAVRYGAVYDPMRDELFEAILGQGAWLNLQPIRVSVIPTLDQALVATGFPYDVSHRLEGTLKRFSRMLTLAQGVRRPGSAAQDLCYVAAGRFDGFWEENLKPWDTAAAALIVTEAGGRLSTLDGGPFKPTAPNIVASNGQLHEQLLAGLRIS